MRKKYLLITTILLLIFALCGCTKENNTDNTDKEENVFLTQKSKDIDTPVLFSFDLEHPYCDYFTVYGQVEEINNEVIYNSTYLTKKLKAQENSYIEFTLENSYELTLYSYENSDGIVYINDTEYKFSNDEVKVELESGEYKIKLSDSDLYYINITEINHTKTLIFDNGDAISFNLDNVETEEMDEKTRYKFSDGMVIDEYKNGNVEIVEEPKNLEENTEKLDNSKIEE